MNNHNQLQQQHQQGCNKCYVYLLVLYVLCATSIIKLIYEYEHYVKRFIVTLNYFPISNSYFTTTTTNTVVNPNNSKVIIHIGPHKTGTSTIQSYIRNCQKQLQLDNYMLADGNKMSNMKHLATCFDPNKVLIKRCDLKALRNIKKNISKQQYNKNNLLFSAEYLSYSTIEVKKMRNFFEPLYGLKNIIIVIYYRRYYDWLLSYWNQFNKHLLTPIDGNSNKNKNAAHRKTFIEYIQDKEWMDTLYYQGSYVYGIIPKWRNEFGIKNVKIYNMYDLPAGMDDSLSVTFFCDAIPNANHTCQEVQRLEQEQNESLATNLSPPLIYDDLAAAAFQHLLLHTNNRGSSNQETDIIWKQRRQQFYNDLRYNKQKHRILIHKLSRKARVYQEIILGLTEYDFDSKYITCPDNTTLHWLLQRTLETERIYFPEYYTKQGKNEIIQKYQKDKGTKLCTVNATAIILYNNTWKQFFQDHFITMLSNNNKVRITTNNNENDDLESE